MRPIRQADTYNFDPANMKIMYFALIWRAALIRSHKE